MIPVNRPLISQQDIEAVTTDLLDTFISGESPPVARMERALEEFTGRKHAVALSSGTSAIDLLVNQMMIGKGDLCILPTFTIISTVSQLLRAGARVKLIDADINTWSIDAQQAVDQINSDTKLVLPVHIYGLPVDMDPILETATFYDVPVIEDAAEALGVEYKGRKCGNLGHASVFSFYANKLITGGEGGAITTDNDLLASELRRFRSLSHDEERFVHSELGWNFRISGLSASLIASQLNQIDIYKARKMEIGRLYNSGLAGHPWITLAPEITEYARNLYWVFPVLLNSSSPYNARSLQNKLREFQIETRRFFCPMHLQPLAEKYSFDDFQISQFPIANNLWENGLYLPSGLGNTDDEILSVVEALWSLPGLTKPSQRKDA
jgi:perosamine synthetase